MNRISAPPPPVFGIGQHRNQNDVQAFTAKWARYQAMSGDAAGIVATTTLQAAKNAAATVTIFQIQNNAETQIGAPINARVVGGILNAQWSIPRNQKAGAYHFKVSVTVDGKTYIGKTAAALTVRMDGFGAPAPNYSSLNGGR